MRRRRFVVPVLAALSGLGWAAAHAVAHRTVMAEPAAPASGIDHYLRYLTTSMALCLALAVALAAGALVGKDWQGTSRRSLWLFGLVPVAGFVGHSVAEPLLGGSGATSSLASVLPIALFGLLIQIPFALVAVAFARHFLWLAETLAFATAARPLQRAPRPACRYPRPRASHAPTFRLVLTRSGRGPPLLAA